MPVKKTAKKAAAKPAAPKPESKYPYKKLVLPQALKDVPNGRLPEKMLKPIKTGGVMYGPAAEAFNAMFDQAIQHGIKLRNIGDYRSFAQQFALFKQRYSLEDLGRKPQVTRQWDGETWYLRRMAAPSSTPGKSNHGYGLAIDLDVTAGKVLDWLCTNAPTFGFYLQTDDPASPEFEPWHWQYCDGDK